jgi:hypothetical protein
MNKVELLPIDAVVKILNINHPWFGCTGVIVGHEDCGGKIGICHFVKLIDGCTTIRCFKDIMLEVICMCKDDILNPDRLTPGDIVNKFNNEVVIGDEFTYLHAPLLSCKDPHLYTLKSQAFIGPCGPVIEVNEWDCILTLSPGNYLLNCL